MHVVFRRDMDVSSKNRRWRSGPGPHSGLGARTGRAFFWLPFLCTSKEKKLAPYRGAKALDPSFCFGYSACGVPLEAKTTAYKQRLSLSFGQRAHLSLLCKERWPKESTPSLRAFRAARYRSTPLAGFSDGTSMSPRKTTHIPVRRPCGVLSASSVAAEGARRSKAKATANARQGRKPEQRQRRAVPESRRISGTGLACIPA